MTQADHATTREPNRLINETSPYLRQHAHNPVDWFPWGEEAFEKARRENKPIFLSVGYAACHWCHVMERESFEDAAIARVMNERFVNVKVDREERPDVDEIYMTATLMMLGHGGWPMSVFLTPDLKPFYCGTYFPPDNRHGMASFRNVLAAVAQAWEGKREEVLENAGQLAGLVAENAESRAGDAGVLQPDSVSRAVAEFAKHWDRRHGGLDGAPKFPTSGPILLLLRHGHGTGDANSLAMATHTLRCIAHGGIRDHLGGGFHRYSVDNEWLVPHFEKMLYDNAQLAATFIEAWRVTGEELLVEAARDTLDYVLRDMTAPEGGFYSSEDADSEGEEGKFYLWTRDEIEAILGQEDAVLFCERYNVQDNGNFSSHESYHAGKNILHIRNNPDGTGVQSGVGGAESGGHLAAMREKLLTARNERVRPGLDDKIITSWNGLMISAFALGAQIFEDRRYLDAARKAASFILSALRGEDGGLLRTYCQGRAQHRACLDDYAFLAAGLLELYETDFDPAWIREARGLADALNAKFWDEDKGVFYATSGEDPSLIARFIPVYDGAEPSGNAVAANVLLRLAQFTGETAWADQARRVLEANHGNFAKGGLNCSNLLCVLHDALAPDREIVVAGSRDSEDTQAMLRVLRRRFLPHTITALAEPGEAEAAAEWLPLLKDKLPATHGPAVYICQNFTCGAPLTDPGALTAVLDG